MTIQTPDTNHRHDPTGLTDRPHLAHLAICGTCHTVFGEGPEPWQRQLCDCASEWERCVVATDDRAERQTIEALGAAGMSAADLAAWVAQAAARQQQRLQERRRANEKEWRRGGG